MSGIGLKFWKRDVGAGVSTSERDVVTDALIEEKIFGLLAARQEDATICPSEVARALVTGDDYWRNLMPRVRQVGWSLARNDRLHVTRGGVRVEATSGGGPIRFGRPPGATTATLVLQV